MLRQWLKRFGIVKSTAAFALASIVLSVLLTGGINYAITGRVGTISLVIAIVVPAVIAPVFTYILLSLVFKFESLEEQLRQLAITDELTQTYNRRHFIETAEREFARARRYRETFSVVVLDLDDFKFVNDTHGHPAGDQVLRTVSDLCRRNIRQHDTFARYGGEEFVFLLPGLDYAGACEFAERIRRRLAGTPVAFGNRLIHVTASLGVAVYHEGLSDLDSLLTHADQAMYRAKNLGKNRLHGQPPG
mgnify:FL=1